MSDNTWMIRLDPAEITGDGPRLAVKDCIDIVGLPTSHGSAVFGTDATPAAQDAPVVATARQQGARIVGKTSLVELCRHADGINPWSGTPRNPIDPSRIPGGSSSGSAVAVAVDEADIAYGTDTGGSVRTPAACCGVAALKTTIGRVPTHGVLDFSRSLDTVGPLARDVGGLVTGMQLMEPGFSVEPQPRDGPIARLRVGAEADTIDTAVEAALDAAIAAAELHVEDVHIDADEWESWLLATNRLMEFEGHWAHRHLLAHADQLEQRHYDDIVAGAEIPAADVVNHRRYGRGRHTRFNTLLDAYDFLILPTMTAEPVPLDQRAWNTYLTAPFNLAGLPAAAIPVPRADSSRFPASLQIVGPWFAEERILPLAARIEAAVNSDERPRLGREFT